MNGNDLEQDALEITLESLIEASGKTQRELGIALGVTELTIRNWTKRRKIPRLDNAAALAAELGVSLKTLTRSLQIDVAKIPDDGLTDLCLDLATNAAACLQFHGAARSAKLTRSQKTATHKCGSYGKSIYV
jgi:transcriptional regulator with XRE-family HTH domain